jgi:hypothetical protein
MAHVADMIAGAANASAIDVNDYKFSLSAAGAVAATVGVSFEDLTTAIAEMGNSGIKGSDAGTSLKTFLLSLTPSTKKAKEEMQALGIITSDGANRFFDASGKVKSLADVSQVLQDATAGLTQQQKLQAYQTMFGTDAIRTAAVFAKNGAKGFNDLAEAEGASGGAAAVAAKRLDNVAGSVEKLSGTWSTFVILLGKMLLPTLKRIVDQVNTFVGSATQILKQIPDAWRTVLQAFDRQWKDSDTLPSFVRMAGQAGIAARTFFDIFSGNASFSSLVDLSSTLDKLVGPGTTDLLINFAKTAGDAWRAVSSAATGILVPAFEGVKEGIGRLIEFAQGLPAPFWTFVAVFGAVVLGAGPLVAVLGTVASAFGLLLVPLGLLLSPLGLLAAAVATLAVAFQANIGNIQGKLQDLLTVAKPLLDSFGSILKLALGGHVSEAVDLFLTKLGEVAPGIVTLVKNWSDEFAKWAPGAITALLTKTGEFIAGVTKWLGDAIAQVPWADVWNRAVNVVGMMASWFFGLATQLASWIGAEVALIPWAQVWAMAVNVVGAMAVWFVGLAAQFATWIGAEVALIPWKTVWDNATGMTAAMQTALEAQAAGINWTKIAQANHDMASQWADGLNALIAAGEWGKVGKALADALFGTDGSGVIGLYLRAAWFTLNVVYLIYEPIIAFFARVNWVGIGEALAQFWLGALNESWRIATGLFRPVMPPIVVDFVAFIAYLAPQIRNARPTPWARSSTPTTDRPPGRTGTRLRGRRPNRSMASRTRPTP